MMPLPSLVAVMFFALASALGCTREDSAAKVAREGVLAAERACDDAGQTEVCRERVCRDRCDRFADSVHLLEACMARCTGRGTCDSDSDCGRGLVCVMIAPRVRRCAPPPELAPVPPP